MINRYFRFAGYLLPVFIVCTSVALLGARAKPSGADPYTPTKREWLTVAFNALRIEGPPQAGITCEALPDRQDPDALILFVAIVPRPDADELEQRKFASKVLAANRETLELLAKRLGFSDWLVIREKVYSGEQAAP